MLPEQDELLGRRGGSFSGLSGGEGIGAEEVALDESACQFHVDCSRAVRCRGVTRDSREDTFCPPSRSSEGGASAAHCDDAAVSHA